MFQRNLLSAPFWGVARHPRRKSMGSLHDFMLLRYKPPRPRRRPPLKGSQRGLMTRAESRRGRRARPLFNSTTTCSWPSCFGSSFMGSQTCRAARSTQPLPLGSVAQGKSFTAVPMFRHVPEMFQRFWNRVSPSSLLAEPSLSCALFQIKRNR